MHKARLFYQQLINAPEKGIILRRGTTENSGENEANTLAMLYCRRWHDATHKTMKEIH